jgi:hypothetical protein
MTLRSTSRTHLLLVNPAQAQWLDGRGQALPAPPGAATGVRVVADLVEETHVRIEVPGLMGGDRQSYIQVQYQALLPDVALHASWEGASAQPLLPKPFALHAVGVSSSALMGQLDALVQAQHPIEGVWTLSYLLAHWAVRQAHLPRPGWLLLCLCLPYGMRMVLLHDRVPVFSRLLLETEPELQAREVALTLKYLADNRTIGRDTRPQVLPMDASPELGQSLQNQGLALLPAVAPRKAASLLAEVLAQAGQRAPGQLAAAGVRRHHLAQRARQGLRVATVVVLLAGLAGLALQGQALLGGAEQSRARVQQAASMEAQAQALRQDLAQRQINVPLLRLALDVKRLELQQGLDPVQPLWMLGQLLQAHPQAQLVRTEQALRAQACPGAQAAGSEAAAVVPGDAPLRAEWQFEIRPEGGLLPRQRQALLEALGQSVAAWPQWRVKSDPVRLESATALAGGQNATTDAAASAWRWCLGPRAAADGGEPS